MIQQNTVFVLGAGASSSFGFPLGIGLRDAIYADAKKLSEAHGLPSSLTAILEFGYTKSYIGLFAEQLLKSQRKSIDAFLEHRNEFIDLGKLFIARQILQQESLEQLYNNPDWYAYIWDKMNGRFGELHNNHIAFITFNYDRSLETFLLNAMQAAYGKTEQECVEKLATIPIIHVHGQIGSAKNTDSDFVDFGQKRIDSDCLRKAASHIKIIHEDIHESKEFTQAHNLLYRAEQVIILGLGYDAVNLDRLKINKVQCAIHGSSFGLTPMEKRMINSNFGSIRFGPSDHHKALEYLRTSIFLQ